MSNYFKLELKNGEFVVSCEMSISDFVDFCNELISAKVKKGE